MPTNLKEDLAPACLYLRKSREDQEAESRGEGETLTKHRKALLKLASSYQLDITKTFEEVVSGENIMHRPQMLKLLQEIEAGLWRSVLCMDIDRLGRGGMQDQGLIIETFKVAKTRIITPRKIYDLTDEFDEEYTEFEAFMARKELKMITRRLQSGRIRSLEEGNYLATYPPYGYLIEYDRPKGRRYLVKNPDQQKPTELIWQLYHDNALGSGRIAEKLNALGYFTYTGLQWNSASVLHLLKNPVYAGVIVWKKKALKNCSTTELKRKISTRPREEQLWIYQAHAPYISIETFEAVQKMLAKKQQTSCQVKRTLTNPLAGLIKCDFCGSTMVYRPYSKQAAHIICYHKDCPNKSARFIYIEQKLVEGLSLWLANYKSNWGDVEMRRNKSTLSEKEKKISSFKKEITSLQLQKNNLYELLEKQIYTPAMFKERLDLLTCKIIKVEATMRKVESEMYHMLPLRPKAEGLLDLYFLLDDPLRKNKLLKVVLNYASYRKEKNQKNDQFTLFLYPKLPKG